MSRGGVVFRDERRKSWLRSRENPAGMGACDGPEKLGKRAAHSKVDVNPQRQIRPVRSPGAARKWNPEETFFLPDKESISEGSEVVNR